MSGMYKDMAQVRNAMADGTNWSIFQRYPIRVSEHWIRTLGDIYPTLELDKHDDVVYQLRVPSSVPVQVRWKNINPWKLREDAITVDVYDMYDEYTRSFNAIVWVPRHIALDNADSQMLALLSKEACRMVSRQFNQLIPEDMIWDMESGTWRIMTRLNVNFGDEMIGTAAYTCVELHPLSDRFKDNFSYLSRWMKVDMGYRKTSAGKDAAWALCEEANPNT